MKESEEKEVRTFPLYPQLLQGQQTLPNCKPISVGRPGDKSYRTPTTPYFSQKKKGIDILMQVVSLGDNLYEIQCLCIKKALTDILMQTASLGDNLHEMPKLIL